MTDPATVSRPRLGFGQIWNMCFGFLGIQMGFALQNANVSRIFQTLGADIGTIPLLWIAAPATGLLVQPLVGYYSDRTWNRLGRRRPYFLFGAIATTAALFVMPHSPVLWFAAGMLWIMDASINVSMEPFRAFVGDMLPEEQRALGFATQSFFIGTGAVVASMLPWLLVNGLGVSNSAPPGEIPDSVRFAFYIGGTALFVAVLWTVVSTREYPPEQLAAFEGGQVAPADDRPMLVELAQDFVAMPATMRQLAVVQFFSWFALFAMWIYATATITARHFGSTDTSSAAWNEGANWVGVLFAAYNGFAALFAFCLPPLAARLGRRGAHALCLLLGAAGFASVLVLRDPQWLLLSMLGVGIAWASILAMPYAILSVALPAAKMGVYMGIFNFFIVLPQLLAAGLLGWLITSLFDGRADAAFAIGAASLVLAALSLHWVWDPAEASAPNTAETA
ncbi:MAG: MFS transporter [Halieaceae bacterium]|nr:MFS transporter [Halieaceae bacterium]